MENIHISAYMSIKSVVAPRVVGIIFSICPRLRLGPFNNQELHLKREMQWPSKNKNGSLLTGTNLKAFIRNSDSAHLSLPNQQHQTQCQTENKKKLLIIRKAAALLHSRPGCINKANKLMKALTLTLSSIASDRPRPSKDTATRTPVDLCPGRG